MIQDRLWCSNYCHVADCGWASSSAVGQKLEESPTVTPILGRVGLVFELDVASCENSTLLRYISVVVNLRDELLLFVGRAMAIIRRFPHRLRICLTSITAGAAVLLVSGCLVTQDGAADQSGSVFDSETVGHICRGTSMDEVRKKVGLPTSITINDGRSQTWQYHYTSNTDNSLTIFPLFHNENQTKNSHDATITFMNNNVVNVVFDGLRVMKHARSASATSTTCEDTYYPSTQSPNTVPVGPWAGEPSSGTHPQTLAVQMPEGTEISKISEFVSSNNSRLLIITTRPSSQPVTQPTRNPPNPTMPLELPPPATDTMVPFKLSPLDPSGDISVPATTRPSTYSK
jgi:outer membrane protein assembly factor BamE (lipoprotein component of BamABCDE complex)